MSGFVPVCERRCTFFRFSSKRNTKKRHFGPSGGGVGSGEESTHCEGVGDVVGVEAPLGGVAQVIFHGVRVVEVGLQVREHQDRGEEEDGEGQVEVEREVEENQRQQHMCDMRMT